MAKGLKVGDLVTAREPFRLKRDSDGYQNGVKSLRPGIVGRVVDTLKGRSVRVDFDGKTATLASQRLELYVPPAEPTPEATPEPAQEPPATDPINYYNPHFIKMVANTLLRNGGAEPDPEAVVVQIKLVDLPPQVQEQVQALIQAKLDLTPAGSAPVARRKRRAAAAPAEKPKAPNGRRGRRKKNPES